MSENLIRAVRRLSRASEVLAEALGIASDETENVSENGPSGSGEIVPTHRPPNPNTRTNNTSSLDCT